MEEVYPVNKREKTPNPWQGTWDAEHELLMRRLDSTYADLRAIHQDQSYIYRDAPEYKDVKENFGLAQRYLFDWKETKAMLVREQGRKQ